MILKSNVTLVITTSMLSHGYQKNVPEFRIQELMAGMRYWWRASHIFTSSAEMYDYEKSLFGCTDESSPVSFRLKEKKELQTHLVRVNGVKRKLKEKELKKLTELKKEVPELKRLGICPGEKIPLIMLSKSNKNENKYLELLKLSSILGALGQRSRKGHGSFYIKELNDAHPMKEKKDLIGEIDRIMKLDKDNSIVRILGKNDNGFSLTEHEANIKGYPYIKKILVGEPIDKVEFSNRIRTAVKNTKNLYYGQRPKEHFAPPVYITAYKSENNEKIFPIATFLNNTVFGEKPPKDYKTYLTEYEKIII